MNDEADVIVVGAGLAGLVATHELALAGYRVIVVEQEGEASLGGQAYWSMGGLFLVGTPEQRLAGIRDGRDLAVADWFGSARFDRDRWPRRWAEAYVDFASGDKRRYLRALGLRLIPPVMWLERGAGTAEEHGNSVPRLHLTWGSGPEVVGAFSRPVLSAAAAGLVSFRYRHRVGGLATRAGAVTGVHGRILAPASAPRGAPTSRQAVGDFELRAQCVLVATGGIGGDEDLVRKHWPTDRLGPAPDHMLRGVPPHVDGRMLDAVAEHGGSVTNLDRMWHYCEGVGHGNPSWPGHGVRIVPGPSALWLDATGRRLPAPFFPGHDTLGTFRHLLGTGYAHSWLVLSRSIAEREITLSGSDQNSALTDRNLRAYLAGLGSRMPAGVQTLIRRGEDFAEHRTLPGLLDAMSALAPEAPLDRGRVEQELRHHDRQRARRFSKDFQAMSVRNARAYWPDRLFRVSAPHPLLDPAHGPLLAVRLRPLLRKTLGGLETDLQARVLRSDGSATDGLYAAGEAAGFGGGGIHGYQALEGTFLGGCIFSGRTAGRAVAAALG